MPKTATSRLQVKVQPNASRTEIAGWTGQVVRLRTTAPPARGKANRAVAEMLARALEIPLTDIRVARGHASRHKVIEVIGLDQSELLRRVGEALHAADAPSATF